MRKSIAIIIAAWCALPAAQALEQAAPTTESTATQAKQAAGAKKAAQTEKIAAAKTTRLKPSAMFSFDQSGGLTAQHRTFETPIKQLSKEDADKLTALIQESGLLNFRDERKTNKQAADVFVYQFKLTNGRAKYQAVFDDTTLPESFRPLLDFLKNKAVDAGRT